MIPIIVTGAAGRMGKTILAQASLAPAAGKKEFKLVGATEHSGSKAVGEDAGLIAGIGSLGVAIASSLEEVCKAKGAGGKDRPVIIDFSEATATLDNVKTGAAYGCPMVIGTTGLSADHQTVIRNTVRKIPVVLSPNMSVGVNTLFKLVADAAKVLGNGYDLEILEAHHRLKKDAPSGTAVRIAEILAEATGRRYPQDINFHRQGVIGERQPREIGMQVIRGGDIVGEHTVFYCGIGERLEIRHTATSRATFADGALRAALWVSGRKPGLYDMGDVLGL
ncbi:MAG: 4-hydroxy-tetrahydrodipicolinate reductase [Deltaproteobacteria bacterium]|nr:4-hydroxy-tetrahydrodipicolinate reductase [Deltaproteobacteria bacterium]